MGTKSRITRIQLKVNQSYGSAMLGIVSAEPDYKLSLTLNRKLKIALKNVSPVTIPANNSEIIFSRFSDTTSSPGPVCELVSNHSGKNVLLRKLKNIDYIFQVCDPENETDLAEIAASLRNADHITAVFKIDPGAIKDKNLQYLIH